MSALDAAVICELREIHARIFGGNCSFVDDDWKIICVLAKRAVDAGLAVDADTTVLQNLNRMSELRSALAAKDAEIDRLRARIAEMEEALGEIRAAVADGHSTRLWGVDVEPEAMSVIDDMVGQLNVVRKIARKALEG